MSMSPVGASRLTGALATLMLFCSSAAAATIISTTDPAEEQGWTAVEVARGVSHPWGIDWLPDGRALVTSRDGKLFLLAGGTLTNVPMDGLPTPFASGQGGLLDVVVDPAGGARPRVFMTMSTGTSTANRTILVRGDFADGRLTGITTLFRVQPDKSGTEHFGSQLLWLADGTLLMSVGDGGNPPRMIGGMLAREQAQNKLSHLGKILRLTSDGKAAPGNPFYGRSDALPEIWSYGHRNIQGLAREAGTGRIFETEHGPRGGDELNVVEGGKNFGWPVQSYGRDYRTNEPIGQRSVAGIPDPELVWIPSIAPSGLTAYSGHHFPAWRGDLFGGGLVTEDVRRFDLGTDGALRGETRLEIGARVREVEQGPDGYLYVLTDEANGRVLRIEPESDR